MGIGKETSMMVEPMARVGVGIKKNKTILLARCWWCRPLTPALKGLTKRQRQVDLVSSRRARATGRNKEGRKEGSF